MLHAIGVIVRARFLIARNTFWRGKISRKISLVVLALVLGFLAFGIYSLMSALVRFITSDQFVQILQEVSQEQPTLNLPTDFRPYLEALPSIALFGALVLLVLSSFSAVLSSLYLSGDIDMLLVAPVPMRAVFVVKFFSGLLLPYVLLFVLLSPAMLGFGQGLGYGPAYYVMVIVVLALLPLLPFSLGALLVMAVVRVIPARRAREIVGVLGGLVGVAWYLFSQFSRQIAPRVANVQTLESLRNLNLPILPSAWAGRALVAAGEGQWLTLLVYGGLFVVSSVGVFIGALLLAERLYYAGWSNMATQGGKVRRRPTEQAQRGAARPPFVFRLPSFILPPESAAILYKDLRVFPRDLRNLQQLIFPLVMAGIWIFNLITRPEVFSSGVDGQVQNVLGLLAPAGISAFICLTMSTALGGPNISREGKGFWILKTAPISAWRLLLGKLVLAYLPFPVFGTFSVLLISLLQRNRPQDAAAALALVLITGLGVCAITLGLGAAFPKLDWERPNQQSSIQAGCLGPILYLLYLAIAVSAAVGLPLVGLAFPDLSLALTVLGWLVMIALTAGVVYASLAFGAARLERLEVS
jgi:hypothetical protein